MGFDWPGKLRAALTRVYLEKQCLYAKRLMLRGQYPAAAAMRYGLESS